MVDSSDSENDLQMRRLLEATDTTLLSEALYQSNQTKIVNHTDEVPRVSTEEAGGQTIGTALTISQSNDVKVCLPKSQRYLSEDNGDNVGGHFNLPAALQSHIYKKLSDILHAHVEFCDLPLLGTERRKSTTSKVKLLRDAQCYVKPYEEFEYETKGPEKKPIIKRRAIFEESDGAEQQTEEERIRSVAVRVEDLTPGLDSKWTQRPERKDRVFHYKMASNGTIHAKDVENEFSQLRRKNKWTDAKIRMKIKRLE